MQHTRPGPFSLSVRDIVGQPGEMREHDLSVTLAQRWGEGLVRFDGGAVVDVQVRLESVHEGILATGTASSRSVGECGRCLRALDVPVEVEFQDLFAYPGSEASDVEVHDDRVDLEITVRDALVLSLPFQPVCRPDCPGLDPITGERCADAPDAEHQRDPDPRWAALERFASDNAQDDAASASRTQS